MSVRAWRTGASAFALVLLAGCGARGGLLVGGSREIGAGGNTIASPGACNPGDAPVMLASGEDGPLAIALDADSVYYSTGPKTTCAPLPRVKRIPKVGGAPAVVAQGMQLPAAIAVDAQSVYFSDDPSSPCTLPDDPGYTLFAAPKGGGPPLSFPGKLDQPAGMALDTDFVYWAIQNGGAIYRAAKGGGKAEMLFPGSGFALSLAVDEDAIYWTGDQGVLRAPKASPATPVVFLPNGMDGAPNEVTTWHDWIALDGGYLYWTGGTLCAGPSCGLVSRVATTGGAVTTIASSQDWLPVRLAVGPTSVYLVALDLAPGANTGSVIRAPKSGGASEVIAKGRLPAGIAVDESCVYWTDTADGSVWRAPL